MRPEESGLNLYIWIASLAVISHCDVVADDHVVLDADTIRLGNLSYRLDGIDAPESDQCNQPEPGERPDMSRTGFKPTIDSDGGPLH
jgi:hypothetical protein